MISERQKIKTCFKTTCILENLPENEEDSSYVNDELMRDMSYNQLPNSRFGLSFIKQMIKPPKMFKK